MIRVEREGAVAIVTIDRQEAMNALDVATLGDAILKLADGEGVTVINESLR